MRITAPPAEHGAARPKKQLSRTDELRNMTHRVSALLDSRGYDPAQELINSIDQLNRWIAEELSRETPDKYYMAALEKQKIEIHKELLSYVAPKLRSVDVTGQVDQNITVVVGLKKPPKTDALEGAKKLNSWPA